MAKIKNPVLTGFNPDPSMIYVDGVYYIATSTFEWYPGVRIYKSTDLANWELASTPLNRLSLLDMTGNPSGGGVWAPCLTYDDGLFFLVYSNVRSWIDTPSVDVENYLITCDTIDGVWSERIYLNSSGFDPSLYHDSDGKKYILNMEWDFRQDFDNKFPGIILQEYNHKQKKLVGTSTNIFKGTTLGFAEGPHIYKKDEYYYLFCAEGGTSWEHAESVSRSKHILGPYEVHPNEFIIKSGDKSSYLHKTGHASICQNDQGKWYLAHLCGRLTGSVERSVLGRETAIQELIWKDGWPYLISGTNRAANEFENHQDSIKIEETISNYTFDDKSFLNDFQTLRIPLDKETFSITKNRGYLTIVGKESIFSKHNQALIARRQTDFDFYVETEVTFKPKAYQEMAGLIYRYNEANQFYLHLRYM